MKKLNKLGVVLAAAAVVAGCGGGSGDGVSALNQLEAARKTPQGGPKSQTSTPTSPTTSPTSPTTSPTPTTTTGGAMMGVNLEGLSDWARLSPFVDMMKTSRPWGTADAPWIETSAVDSLGWPTGDAGVVVASRQADVSDTGSTYQYLQAGTYRLSFTGKAAVTPTASAGVSVSNYLYDQATNRSTADVVVGSTTDQLLLSFRNTVGGVKNVALTRPGYADTDTFTSDFKQAVAPFTALRFMDFLATNSTSVRTWAERSTPASATQATNGKGGAYEYAIQMGNELGKDIWINVPLNADEAHIRSLADLLNRTLAPGRVVYLEYSNEIWNWAFQQTTANMNLAVAEAVAGDTTLTNGTQCTQAQFDAGNVDACNKYWAGSFRAGKQIVRISQIFSEVMGASALNTRFRPVYATQWGYAAIGEQVLKNIARYRGAPSNFLYGIAGAPYFTLPQETYTSTTLTVDGILQGLQRSVDVDFAPYFTTGMTVNGAFSRGTPYNGGDWTNATQKALADYYKIKSVAYEGGLDLGQSSASATAKMQANKDSRMGDIAKSELDQWFGCGNDLFMYYSLTSAWGQWGYWGLTNDPNNLNAPRYVAAQKVAQTPATDFTTCR
jgi:hypothetical protein